MTNKGCQSVDLDVFYEGTLKYPPLSFPRRVKLEIRKRLSPKAFRSLKRAIDWIISKIGASGQPDRPTAVLTAADQLAAGDRVRVRSREEIESLLNRWKETRGCGFMDGMWDYCGTIQVVKKPVRRFVDERTLEVKKGRSIVILENAHCSGTILFGECDRSCYFFWREEWLEKIT